MKLAYKIDVSGPVGRFDGIAARAGDPTGILKRFGGYFRSQALKRAAAAEGWPPLAESTQKKLQHTRRSHVTVQGDIRKSYGGALGRYLKRQGAAGAADLQELQRLAAVGSVPRDGNKAVEWGGSKAVNRLRKQLAKAAVQRQKGQRARVGGNKRKADGHKLLGAVARSIKFDVQGTSVKTYGKVPFSAVHNDGGEAGHGAEEPQRVFLTITAEDKIVLASIALSHLVGGPSR